MGDPLRFILTVGQKRDITQAQGPIAGYAGEHVVADNGYDSQEFRQHTLERGMNPVIPPRSNRKDPKTTMPPCTGSATWWNASSTR